MDIAFGCGIRMVSVKGGASVLVQLGIKERFEACVVKTSR
jgi:hypothetical protein